MTDDRQTARSCPCDDDTCHLDREEKMVPVTFGGKVVGSCDPCIAMIVQALNDAGIRTKASCCGHGFRPGNIVLADGRELVIAPDFAAGRAIDRLFPVDINGDVAFKDDRQTADDEMAIALADLTFGHVTSLSGVAKRRWDELRRNAYAALTRARSEGRKEAARFADEQAAAIERAAYPQGALSAEWPEAMKWRKIASAIRSLAEKEKNDG